MTNKKEFIIPQLTVHGNVEEITESGSANNIVDAPLGGLSDNDDISGVSS